MGDAAHGSRSDSERTAPCGIAAPSPGAGGDGEAQLILASASPRRRELLAALGLPFAVQAADVPEPLLEGIPAAEQAVTLALAKARAVAEQVPHLPVLGADTIVVLDGRPLGKPASAAEARSMLVALRDRPHEVVTGVALIAGGHEQSAHAATTVWMRPYRDAEIEAYIATGDPFDKAGAYAIQHPGFHPVARIDGCYCNVMGLPLWTVRALLLAALPGAAVTKPGHVLERCGGCSVAGV